MVEPRTVNLRVAARLREASQLLRARGVNGQSVRAYRKAADAIQRLPRDVRRVYAAGGVKGLDVIPWIGLGIATDVAEVLEARPESRLERLRAAADPQTLFATLPGIGPTLARRIPAELGARSLEDLQASARDGRLAAMRGVGRRRAAGVRDALEERLTLEGAALPLR